ncbi:ATP-binding protein [Bradyrhizobium sp. NBAIM01]|uniref:AlbA family DNA-binding domain-containing protein n=1 Tax=Bradyrhizobium sp. NBAIM01 TaxID=2793818 RepID=UPI001CD56B09|nr:ATP-binding protein [Bradyrhizobium sp. NBAIM01]MCA1514588.1 ATP-binding protein [Bradyrhizobium sp. NBAIM01]
MPLKLETRADLEALHTNQVTETSALEYKASGSVDNTDGKKAEMAKDVSAMANANGGQIVYGMTEKDHLPSGLDAGVSPKPFDGLWFEQVIQQNIKPPVGGLKIEVVPAGNGNNYIVLTIPASKTVHQAKDGRYYRRRNFRIDIMEDYEIREAINRATTPEPYVEIWFSSRPKIISWSANDTHSRPVPLNLRIGNRSTAPALYTHVSLFLGEGLIVVSSGGTSVDETTTTDGKKIRQLQFALVVPHHLPLFREKTFRLGNGTSIAIPLAHRSDDMSYRIGVEVATPGYSTISTGYIAKRGNALTLSWEPWTA